MILLSLMIALAVYLGLVTAMPAIWAVSIALIIFLGLSGVTNDSHA